MTLEEALRSLRKRLSFCSDEADFEANLILMKATGLERSVLLSHPEREMTCEAQRVMETLVSGREQGTPLPYLLGSRGFFGLDFKVTPAVLIPRPETEMLVETALEWLHENPDVCEGADIGTGSGCIAVSLLKTCSRLHMKAVDISEDALAVARENAASHEVCDRFLPIQGNLCEPLHPLPGLICANLPYIPSQTCAELETAKHEPLSALDGGTDGFALYREMFADISSRIPGGAMLILCEIEYRQRELAPETAALFFPQAGIRVENDLAGFPRLLRIEIK